MQHRRTGPITRIAYYDRIAKQWHRVTGHHGGAFKRAVQTYLDALNGSGFAVVAEPVRPDEKTMRAKPGLKLPRDTPLALVFDCHAI